MTQHYRLPADTHLGQVKLQIADLERSLAYYTRVIGLRTIQRAGDCAVLGAHGDDTPIVELVEKKGARTVPRRGLLGLYHFAILLPDRAALGRFVRHLSELNVAAGMSDHLVSEAIYLQDPDNLGIEVYADRPQSAWRYDQGQLSMATTPLDVDDLMAASGSDPWDGAPAGTRLGHVHLHVGDIERAAAFYHDALGFDKKVWNYPGALFLAAGSYHHHLGINTWARGAASASVDDARLLDWEIVVPKQTDVDDVTRSLEDKGYSVSRDGTAAVARDPWGTQLSARARREGEPAV